MIGVKMSNELKRVFGHLGKIFTNISIVGIIVTIVSILAPNVMIIPSIIYIMVVVISVVTIIPILIESYRQVLFYEIPGYIFTDNAYEIVSKMFVVIPMAALISIIATILAIGFLTIDHKNIQSQKRLLLVGIFVLAFILTIVIVALGGANG